MIGRTLGGRSADPLKYQKDAETLLKALKDEPENERYVFYLAQSYRDAGMRDESVKYYKKRVEMGKWIEEVYISALNISRITGDREWAWRAHEYAPKRIESLVSYAGMCRATNKWSRELLSMIMYASTIPKPSDQALFIENDIYDWKVWDELAIIGYYTGNKEISKIACIKLLSENKFPPEQKARIEANLKCALN
jgi:tetratricopeptide (TPR) repeat protein